MLDDFRNKIKKKNYNLKFIDSNFIKVNSIMNQRLIGLVDYLKASIYFSHYKDKKSNNDCKNLEKFFKNKIFSTNPFHIQTLKHSLNSNLSEDKKRNRPLDITVNIKDNKLTFQKNKYSTPYDLHSKKNNFLKNMVDFSKHIHSESKMEEDLKQKYPKIESFPLYQEGNNHQNFFPFTPKSSRIKLLIKTTDGYTSTYDDKNSYFKSNKKFKNKIRNTKRYLSLDNNLDTYKIKSKMKNNNFISQNNNKNLLSTNIIKGQVKKNMKKNKTAKLFRANCYYNNLHLQKLSKNLLKYTYLNEDQN